MRIAAREWCVVGCWRRGSWTTAKEEHIGSMALGGAMCHVSLWGVTLGQHMQPYRIQQLGRHRLMRLPWAHKGVLCIFALGYVTIQALARLAAAGAYFFTRRNHQTTICAPSAGGIQHIALVQMLDAVEGHCVETDICIGAKALVPSRLVAVRMPEALVNERRSIAKKHAKKKGDAPSKAHRALLAWHLFLRNVPHMMWQTETVGKTSPIRWHIARIFTSWKRSLH